MAFKLPDLNGTGAPRKNLKYVFEPGQIFFGVEVLKRDAFPKLAHNRYFIRYLCCGREQWVTHAAMRSRAAKVSQRCAACAKALNAVKAVAANHAAAEARHQQRVADQQRPPAPGGIEDANGHWWPALGRMGPRWGEKNTNACSRRDGAA